MQCSTNEKMKSLDCKLSHFCIWWFDREDYYQEGNYVHPRLKVLEAYKRALTTWARWVDKNIDVKRTQVFFRGYSVTHFRYRTVFSCFVASPLFMLSNCWRYLELTLGNLSLFRFSSYHNSITEIYVRIL